MSPRLVGFPRLVYAGREIIISSTMGRGDEVRGRREETTRGAQVLHQSPSQRLLRPKRMEPSYDNRSWGKPRQFLQRNGAYKGAECTASGTSLRVQHFSQVGEPR